MPGSRQLTLKDVAQRAGVNVATASRALSNEQSHLVSDATRMRVRTIAESLGYRANAVAQSLRKGSTGVLGVVVAYLANPFIVSLLRGIEQEARTHDMMPAVAETRDDPETLRSVAIRLLRNRVDAIILSAIHTADEAFVADLERRVPVVLAVRGLGAYPDENSNGDHLEVLQDDVLGARTATTHLLKLGHRRIAGIPGDEAFSSFAWRSEGFRLAIAAHPAATDVSTGTRALESTLAEGRRLQQAGWHQSERGAHHARPRIC